MTTIPFNEVPYTRTPSADDPSCWVPLDEITQRWAMLGASASTSHDNRAVGAAFTALAQERLALRHATLAQEARPSPFWHAALLSLWSEGYQQHECCLEALVEAVSCWHRAASALDQHAETIPEEEHEPFRMVRSFIGDALFQRARLGHLIAQVLEAQALSYQQQVLSDKHGQGQRGAQP